MELRKHLKRRELRILKIPKYSSLKVDIIIRTWNKGINGSQDRKVKTFQCQWWVYLDLPRNMPIKGSLNIQSQANIITKRSIPSWTLPDRKCTLSAVQRDSHPTILILNSTQRGLIWCHWEIRVQLKMPAVWAAYYFLIWAQKAPTQPRSKLVIHMKKILSATQSIYSSIPNQCRRVVKTLRKAN